MSFSLTDIPLALLAIILSVLALWLNYRTSRRQRLAEDPLLILRRGPRGNPITITNQGRSPAIRLAAKTVGGGFIRWSNQFNQTLQKRDSMGGIVGGEEPWTPDCSGETRTIAPGDSASLVLADEIAPDEVLVFAYENYTGRRICLRHRLSEIPIS
jgi:hypothetical protein